MLVLAIGLGPGQAAAQVPEHADVERAAVVIRLFDALNRGDGDAATELYAENAFLVGGVATGLCSLETPCYGP